MFLLAATSVSAHHAYAAEFDIKKPVRLEGPILRLEWINPHAWIHIGVIEPDGSVVIWSVEGASPNALLRAGVQRAWLKPGTTVIVNGSLARNGQRMAYGAEVLLPDGKKVLFASPSGE